MKQEYNIVGENLTDSHISQAAEILDKNRKESLKPLPGEEEKSSEEYILIERINDYLSQEFQQLGIELKSDILSEQIHLLPHEIFSQYFPEQEEHGFYDNKMGAIYIDKSQYNQAELFSTMLHEAVHFYSAHKYYFEQENKEINYIKSGYHIENPCKDNSGRLKIFNEAIVEMTVEEIIQKHLDELAQKFNTNTVDFKEQLPQYFNRDTSIIEVIIHKIAEKNNEEAFHVWERFKKGQFTGAMMHLRDIEKVFGHGAIVFIAAMETGMKDLPKEKFRQKLLEYFEADTQEKRNEIANEVLNDEEKGKYQKAANQLKSS